MFVKTLKSKEKFEDNDFHNILRLFDVLTNFSFNTCEWMGNYCLQTWNIRVVFRLSKRFKTEDPRKLENII